MNTEKTTEKKSHSLSMKSSLILVIVSPVIVIILCSAAIVLSVQKIEAEPTTEITTEPIQYVIDEPSEDNQAAAEIKELLDDIIKSDDVRIQYSPSVSAEMKSSSLPEGENRLVTYAVGKTGSALGSEYYDSSLHSTAYGDTPSLSDGIYPAADSSPSFEKTDDEKFVYKYTPAKSDGGMFAAEDEKMRSELSERYGEFLSVSADGIKTVLTDAEVTLKANPKTGKAEEITLTRIFTVTFDGSDTAAAFEAEINASAKFTVTFAGISIEQSLVTLHGNGYEDLQITANVDENAAQDEFTLVFTSSDPSVCTVNENGTVEAVRISDTPVTVTATLTYLGKTYTDTCTVIVAEDGNKLLSSSGAMNIMHNGKEVG